jgi:NOL1/NOP2/fmu family ribosome biogenesis protein
MLKPGGRLVYSTCTFNDLENEGSIRGFLSRHPDFTPEDFALNGIGPSTGGMLHVYPHRVRGDGHFVAKLRKAGESRAVKPIPFKPDPAAPKLLKRLEDEIGPLPDWLDRMRVTLAGDRLLAVPADAPDLNGVRVVTPGLWLMRAGRSHIEPEHPLAMALDTSRLTAELDDRQAAAYLSGEALPVDGPRGWTLVTWRGMPLGWGKQTGDTLKNHLPKGLRKGINLL